MQISETRIRKLVFHFLNESDQHKINRKITFSEAEKLIEILKKERFEPFHPQNEQEQELAVMLDMRKEKGTVPDFKKYNQAKEEFFEKIDDETFEIFKRKILEKINLNILHEMYERMFSEIYTTTRYDLFRPFDKHDLIENIGKYCSDLNFNFDFEPMIKAISELETALLIQYDDDYDGIEMQDIEVENFRGTIETLSILLYILHIINFKAKYLKNKHKEFEASVREFRNRFDSIANLDFHKYIEILKKTRFMQEWNEYAN